MKNISLTTMNMLMCYGGMQMYNGIDVFRACYKA